MSTQTQISKIISEIPASEQHSNSNQTGQRNASRFPYPMDVHYTDGVDYYQDCIRNISKGGLFIEAETPRVKIDTEIKLMIPSSGYQTYSRLKGKVIRKTNEGFALSFLTR
jgi:PilZ domain